MQIILVYLIICSAVIYTVVSLISSLTKKKEGCNANCGIKEVCKKQNIN